MHPLLYSELAPWWPLMSDPADYEEEAEVFGKTLVDVSRRSVRRVLELGSGGGNNAVHMKRHFEMTLADISSEMLAVSRRLNPDCTHHVGDMRTMTLGMTFDAVFVHDAITYMTTEHDLAEVMRNAWRHLEPGGTALFVPDFVSETFREHTSEGGHDRGPMSLRYLQWTWDPDPSDSTYCSEYAYLLHDDGDAQCVCDRHTLGIFPETDWLNLLSDVGFEGRMIPYALSDSGWRKPLMFAGTKPVG